MRRKKAQARLERRLRGYEQTLKNVGPERARGFNRPGSVTKSAPKGRS